MSTSIRLSFNLLLPLLFGSASFAALYLLTRNFGENSTVYAGIGAISLLLAALPVAVYRLFIKSQIQTGFAQLEDGNIFLPEELQLGPLLKGSIENWLPYEHTLHTTVCLQGKDERIFVTLNLNLTLSADHDGKRIAKHLDKALSQLEQAVQHTLYNASQMDPDMANSLNGSVLLNEDDEAVLKSKFLSALEMIELRGVSFPVTTDGIHLNRNVRKEKIELPAARQDADDWPDEDDLMLNDDLLKSLGVN